MCKQTFISVLDSLSASYIFKFMNRISHQDVLYLLLNFIAEGELKIHA